MRNEHRRLGRTGAAPTEFRTCARARRTYDIEKHKWAVPTIDEDGRPLSVSTAAARQVCRSGEDGAWSEHR